MESSPLCPVCGKNDWALFGKRTYHAKSINSAVAWQRKALRILFEVWCPNKEAFSAEFVGCNACSMMIYRPRPSAADLEAKYLYAARLGDEIRSDVEQQGRTRARVKRLTSIVTPHLDRTRSGPLKVLDYGGGDGRLLASFVAAGAKCDLLDYCGDQIPGVEKVGETISDLADDALYDLIVCSHVVEHLAAPIDILGALKAHLTPTGVIYVEVPVEVVGNLPAKNEPVTHLNFFIPESLEALLENCGYEVLSCDLIPYPHPNGGWRFAAGAVAKAGAAATRADRGIEPLKRYMSPSPAFWAKLSPVLIRNTPHLAKKAVRRMKAYIAA